VNANAYQNERTSENEGEMFNEYFFLCYSQSSIRPSINLSSSNQNVFVVPHLEASKKYRQWTRGKKIEAVDCIRKQHKKAGALNIGTQTHMPPSILFIINHVYGPVL
jgi:hypothetical protein